MFTKHTIHLFTISISPINAMLRTGEEQRKTTFHRTTHAHKFYNWWLEVNTNFTTVLDTVNGLNGYIKLYFSAKNILYQCFWLLRCYFLSVKFVQTCSRHVWMLFLSERCHPDNLPSYPRVTLRSSYLNSPNVWSSPVSVCMLLEYFEK